MNLVSLTGGLGNQLFQFAAGIYVSKGKELSIISSLGNPRLNEHGLPQILDYELPEFSKFITAPRYLFAQKVAGYALRSSIAPRSIERKKFFDIPKKHFQNLVLSLYLKSNIEVLTSKDVGYSPLNLRESNLMIGYFQSFKWANDAFTLRQLKSLKLKSPDRIFPLITTPYDKRLIVHVRRGDYRLEPKFGCLSMQYYKDAISSILNKQVIESIWFFSDEILDLYHFLPNDFNSKIEIADYSNSKFTPIENLELMKYGKFYIIGNSSFSWWGAFLSKSSAPHVIAPHPWFRSLPEPVDLIPSSWFRNHAIFE